MLNSLLAKLTKEFPKADKTCLKNVLLLTLGIISKETVCLNKLKGAIGALTGKQETCPSSHYKRLIRIFDSYSFSSLWLDLLSFVFKVFNGKVEYLLLDGTSWQRGGRKFHFLTLCIVYQGVGLPIYWEDLEKKGISNFRERKKLLSKAMKRYQLKGKTLLADREYIGVEWFKFLIDNEIDFVIRLKGKAYKQEIDKANGRSYSAMTKKALNSKLGRKSIKKAFVLAGMHLTFVVVKNPKNDPKEPVIYLISNLTGHAYSISERYPIRWKIETCFRHLKSNGFHLEQINLKGKSRCRLLMAITVFAYAISVHEGLKDYKKVPLKNFQEGRCYKAVSVFRNGIDRVTVITYDIIQFVAYILKEFVVNLPNYKANKSIIV